MAVLDNLIENIDRLALHYNLTTYKEIADFLNVSEDALKHWKNKSRCPSLLTVDQIGDTIGCYSYALLQKNGDIFANIELIENASREKLIKNLQAIFLQEGKFTWSDKSALFYGFVSEDNLKSYFRKKNYKVPPLKRLEEMAEALGMPVYELLKEGIFDEKENKQRSESKITKN